MAGVVILGAGELGGALAHKLAARDRVRSVCLVDAAKGVAAEITITREEGKPYFLLRGHANCTKPGMARVSDEIHAWNWPNLQKLIYAQG